MKVLIEFFTEILHCVQNDRIKPVEGFSVATPPLLSSLSICYCHPELLLVILSEAKDLWWAIKFVLRG